MIKQTPRQDNAVGLLTVAVAKASAEIAYQEGLYSRPISEEFVIELTKVVKITLKNNIERILAEWKEATEANISEAWLKKLMETQAVELAQLVVKAL